jgi:hypothetical protein
MHRMKSAAATLVTLSIVAGCARAAPGTVAPPAAAPPVAAASPDDIAERRALARAVAAWHATPVGTSVVSIALENRVTPVFSAWGGEPSGRRGGIRKLLAARVALDGQVLYASSSPDVPSGRRAKPEAWFERLPEDEALFDAESTVWSGAVEPGPHVLVTDLVYLDGWCCGYGGACFPRRFVTLHDERSLRVEAGSATLVRLVGAPPDGPRWVSESPPFRLEVKERAWWRIEVLSPR